MASLTSPRCHQKEEKKRDHKKKERRYFQLNEADALCFTGEKRIEFQGKIDHDVVIYIINGVVNNFIYIANGLVDSISCTFTLMFTLLMMLLIDCLSVVCDNMFNMKMSKA